MQEVYLTVSAVSPPLSPHNANDLSPSETPELSLCDEMMGALS